MFAIKIEDFIDLTDYEQEIEYLVKWVKSSAKLPGTDEIYVPGDFEQRSREKRLKEGIPIEKPTWDRLVEAAERFDVAIPTSLFP
jgi:LDH2 family malate/lactate/ureidoglycolate dehydrogenase